MKVRLALVASLLLVAGCREDGEAAAPRAVAMTDEALGHYCQMDLREHDGPVAQIHLAGFDHPIWFSQVRDAIAYTRLPEENGWPHP